MRKPLLAGAAAALCCAGLAMAQPANDNCSNAQAVAVPSVTTGTTVGATVEAGPPQTCITSYTGSAGVWYTLVGNGNTLTVDTCTSGTFDTKLHVYCSTNANPCSVVTALTCVGGSDDACATQSRVIFCSAAGQTYHILVSAFGAATTGTFTLTVADGAACTTAVACTGTTAGACCNNTTQVCTVTLQASCSTTTSTFQGVGSACTYQSPCTGVGACCSSTGICSVVLPANCTGTSTFTMVGTACLPSNPCTPLLRACCSSSGACSLTTPAGCAGATQTFLSTVTTCAAPNPCTPLLGACCANATGACTTTTTNGCPATSTFLGVGTTCGLDLCANTGACCSGSGGCTVSTAANCTGTSTFTAVGTPCLPTNPCTPLLRACCSSSGSCSLTTAAGCAGATQTFLSTATTCAAPNPCTPLLGACCNTATSACTTTTTNGCPAATSTFLGVGTVCGVNLCPNTGACCAPSGTCSVTTATGCAATSFFQGVGVACGPTNPCLALSGACCANTGVCTVRPVSDCTAPSLFAGIATTCGAGDVCPLTVRACCNNTTGVCTFQTATCPTGSTQIGTVCSPTPCPSTPPIAAAADFGDPVGERGTVVLQVTITTPGNNPPSASYTVTTDASSLGGPMSLALLDNGLGVDLAAGDNIFAGAVNVTSASGAYPLTFTVMDDQMRTPTAAVATTVNVAAINGACCAPSGSCSVLGGNACVAGGGTFQGVGTVCSGPFYNLSSSTSAFASIAATGTLLSNTNSDDAVATIPIGFTFNYLGTDFTDVSVSSNGNLQFGGTSTSFSNVAIPNIADPNSMLAPLWDDFNALTAGDIYSRLDGAAPNRTLTISWEGVPQFGAPAGDSNNFQVVLFEGSNNFEFRYGALSTAIVAVNDFATVGFENSAGTAGRGIERNTLHAGNTAIAGTRVDVTNPCPPPIRGACCEPDGSCSLTAPTACVAPNVYLGDESTCQMVVGCPANGSCCAPDGSCTVTFEQGCPTSSVWVSGGTCGPNACRGACCCGSTCTLSLSATCAGPNTRFSGVGTACNAAGNNTSPCCRADYNQSGAVSVQDIFDFLAGYFGGDVCTDINASGPPPSVQDIFDFLAAYFAGCV